MLPVVSLVMMMWWYGFETNFWKCHRRSRQSGHKIGGCFLGEGWKETTSFHRCQKGSWYGFETIMKSIHDVNEKCSFTALGWLLCKCSWSWLSYEDVLPLMAVSMSFSSRLAYLLFIASMGQVRQQTVPPDFESRFYIWFSGRFWKRKIIGWLEHHVYWYTMKLSPTCSDITGYVSRTTPDVKHRFYLN